MKTTMKYTLLGTFSLFFMSCFEANTKELEKSISKIQDNQKIILQKIDRLEQGQRSLTQKLNSQGNKAANNKQANNKPKADPNKVYDIAVGNSVVKGNPNAKVTIIEWMDFQ